MKLTKKKLISIIAVAMSVVIAATIILTATLCKKKDSRDTRDSVVLMTEDLSGLFNPFYATSGADQDVIGMTQIGMLSTNDKGEPEAGDDLPTVVKAFDVKTEVTGDNAETKYTFVIKNNLKFSDGEPLTMNDVLFNMYEYLDPVYTGSSTMYSTKIKGLDAYRTQTLTSSGGASTEEGINVQANSYATVRNRELINLYKKVAEKGKNSYDADVTTMKAAIENATITPGYKMAVATDAEQATWTAAEYRAILQADYQLVLDTFKKELEGDFRAAKESYDLTVAPYKEHASLLEDDIFKFFLYEGKIKPEYEKIQGKENKEKIVKFEYILHPEDFTQETAIQRVFDDTIRYNLLDVLQLWGTAGTVKTLYAAEAKEILLSKNIKDGQMLVPNISGIKSLGHTENVTKVTVKGTEYPVARTHKEDGTPTNSTEYDVLEITVEGTDPKAIFNFGFGVAPAHYYTANDDGTIPAERKIDIKNNKFGVVFASYDFQTKVIQSLKHVEVPVGAGPFVATDASNNDNPSGSQFWSSKIVYFKKNVNFMFDVKAEKLRLQEISASNALDKLRSGDVDYVTPQYTKENAKQLAAMEEDGIVQLSSWQLGYGYIGVNAGKVPNINVRRAIMAALQNSVALEFYEVGSCKNIDWPLSMVSWAYPFKTGDINNGTSESNNTDYLQWKGDAEAKATIQKYMTAANVKAGDTQLKIKFTIAGASITEHPTYPIFKKSAELLNSMGWQVDVVADSQALTKLSTGSLAVWAAAWGSTIDPDMYQVYHKNSTATSVYSWGYREIKANEGNKYTEEQKIINRLSEKIDAGRKTMDQEVRKGIYKGAMKDVLELAVEMPVYQRKTMYAYNSKHIKGLSNEVNPYTSPLEKIWELELA